MEVQQRQISRISRKDKRTIRLLCTFLCEFSLTQRPFSLSVTRRRSRRQELKMPNETLPKSLRYSTGNASPRINNDR